MHGEESGGEKALKEQYETEMLAPSDYEAERKSHPSICMWIWMRFVHLPTHRIRFSSPNTLLLKSWKQKLEAHVPHFPFLPSPN
jgi:hypothetical protein